MKGIYQHYKGNLYEVLHEAVHSESGEVLVVYRAIADGKVWVRPKSMFLETVIINNNAIPRFKKF